MSLPRVDSQCNCSQDFTVNQKNRRKIVIVLCTRIGHSSRFIFSTNYSYQKFVKLLSKSSWVQVLERKCYSEELRIAFHIMRKKVKAILIPTFIHRRIEEAGNANADRVVKFSLQYCSVHKRLSLGVWRY